MCLSVTIRFIVSRVPQIQYIKSSYLTIKLVLCIRISIYLSLYRVSYFYNYVKISCAKISFDFTRFLVFSVFRFILVSSFF